MIDRLVAGRRQPATTQLGPGDDAAVIGCADARTVVSVDMLVEKRHFRLDWSTPQDVGRKAIAQNAADIEAMGARPTAFVVGFGAPAGTLAADVVALTDGMWTEAERVGAGVVGGDLVQADCWVISVTVLGDLAGRDPVLRSGARPGATLAVAGELGRSAAGLRLWTEGVATPDMAQLRARHLVPEPPYGQGVVAADAGAQAMTDVSDGLIADLGHLAVASQVTIDVDTTALGPDYQMLAAAGAAVGVDPWSWILGGGEDHALVAVFPGVAPTGWRPVGQVLAGPPRVLVDGAPWAGEAGWQSFDSEAPIR